VVSSQKAPEPLTMAFDDDWPQSPPFSPLDGGEDAGN
jgi:hypothetical protein